MPPEIQELIRNIQTLMDYVDANSGNINEETQQAIAGLLGGTNRFIQEFGGGPDVDNVPPEVINGPSPSENANLLWILAGGQEQAFVSYLREFQDPSLQGLLENPTLLAQTIQQLQRNNPIEHIGQADGIPQADLQSSNVYGFRFNPRNKKLQVRFQGGSLYEYDNVPDSIFNLFSHGNATAKTNGKNEYGQWWKGKNPSLGASLNAYIKAGGYNYRKLH
jgi:hypothetical protein